MCVETRDHRSVIVMNHTRRPAAPEAEAQVLRSAQDVPGKLLVLVRQDYLIGLASISKSVCEILRLMATSCAEGSQEIAPTIVARPRAEDANHPSGSRH